MCINPTRDCVVVANKNICFNLTCVTAYFNLGSVQEMPQVLIADLDPQIRGQGTLVYL